MNITFTSNKPGLMISKWTWPTVGYSITIDVSVLDNTTGGDLDLLKTATATGLLSSDQPMDQFVIQNDPVDDLVGRNVRAVVQPNGGIMLVAEGLGPISLASLDGGTGGTGGTGTSVEVINDLTTGGTTAALSAEQGRVLNNLKYVRPASGIPFVDLSAPVQASLGKADTALQSVPVATATTPGTVKVGSGLAVAGDGTVSALAQPMGDATTTTKGAVQLAGDLGGTAAAPTVPGLANKQDTLVSGTNVKTIAGKSIVGSGDVTLSATDVGALTKATADTLYATLAQGAKADTALQPSKLGASGGIATLDTNGQLTASQVPDIAVVQFLGQVASQSAMLALVGQKGDWCIRTDVGAIYIINGTDPTLVSSWTLLSYPTTGVITVAGKNGNVRLYASDLSDASSPGIALLTAASLAAQKAILGIDNVNNTTDANKPVSTAQAAAIATAATTATWGSVTGTLSAQTDVSNAINAAATTATWGDVTGTLANQTDVNNAINAAATTATWGDVVGTLTNQTDLVNYIAAQVAGAGSGTGSSALPPGYQNGDVLYVTSGVPAWASAETVVSAALRNLNLMPVANSDTANGTENTVLSGNVLTNDTTLTGTLRVTKYSVQTLSNGTQTYTAGVSSTTNPYGTFVMNQDGSWTMTPRQYEYGTLPAITYTVTNGLAEVTGTLTITLAHVNQAPIVVDDNVNGVVNTPITISVLANDYDPDGNPLTVTQINGTAISVGGSVSLTNGSVVLNSNQTITLTPSSGFTGAISFTYTVSDGSLSTTGNVSVVISTIQGGGGTSNYLNTTTTAITYNWAGTLPTKGGSAVEPVTGATIRRLTDVTQDFPSLVALYNGYSRYPNENITGEYVLAFGSNSTTTLVLDRATGGIVASLAYDNSGLATHTVGVYHEVRWHYTAAHPYRVYFTLGTQFWMIDDIRSQSTTRTMIKDFGTVIDWSTTPNNSRRIYMDQEGNSSLDSDHWGWMAAYYDTTVNQFVVRAYVHYQVSTDTTHLMYPSGLTGFTSAPANESTRTTFSYRPNMVEVSPDGSVFIMHHNRAYPGNQDAYVGTNMEAPYAWPIDFKPSTMTPFRLASDSTHSGWSSVGGVWYFVGQDNRRDKWCGVPISGSPRGYGNEGQIDVTLALSPAVIDFYNDGNPYPGMHFGVCTGAADGWALVSTYSTTPLSSNGVANAVFLMQVKPAAQAVHYMVSPTCNSYPVAKQDFNEAPCSINLAGTRILTCGDWTSNTGTYVDPNGITQHYIDMFEIALPTNWQNHFVPAAPVNTAAPTESGTATQGQTLTATPGTWTGFPTPTIVGNWQRGTTDIAGATALTYQLQAADVGYTIRYRETATNSSGSATAYSNSSASVAALAIPVNSGVPVITGTAQQGNTLNGSNGTWTNSPTSYAYQWLRDGVAISGATTSSYVIQAADVGHVLAFQVIATNALGSSSPATSANTATVTLNPGTVSRVSYVTSVDPSGSTEMSRALPAMDVAAGNLIIVGVSFGQTGSNTISSVTDTAGNTYTAGTTYTTLSGGIPAVAQIWYCLSSVAQTGNVITVTQSGGSGGGSVNLDCAAVQYHASAGTWTLSSQTGIGTDYVPLPVTTPTFNMPANSVALCHVSNYYSNTLPISTGGATQVDTLQTYGWEMEKITGSALTSQSFTTGDSQSGGYSRLAIAVGVFVAA